MSLRLILIGASLIAAAFLTPTVQSADAVTVTALASEGIIIRSGDKVILIDAFVDPHEIEGDSVLTALHQAMMDAQPPFASVSLVLVSHPHHEHFHAPTAGRFLKKHRETILAASPEIIRAVRDMYSADSVLDRQLASIKTEEKNLSSATLAGIEVDFIPFRHEASMLYSEQVLGQIIHIGGKKILYVSDAEMQADNWKPYDLKSRDIDVALTPEWLFAQETAREIIDEFISPDKVVVIQVPPAGYKKKFTEMKVALPNVYILNKAKDSIKF